MEGREDEKGLVCRTNRQPKDDIRAIGLKREVLSEELARVIGVEANGERGVYVCEEGGVCVGEAGTPGVDCPWWGVRVGVRGWSE
jgi:hypothetical protein